MCELECQYITHVAAGKHFCRILLRRLLFEVSMGPRKSKPRRKISTEPLPLITWSDSNEPPLIAALMDYVDAAIEIAIEVALHPADRQNYLNRKRLRTELVKRVRSLGVASPQQKPRP
jgi:hypothetical protein